jgi:hypothetical protein
MHASMRDRRLSRRAALLLPLLLAACGGEERMDFPTLRYSYLRPIRLNVANIAIEQHFQPSGVAPDVTQLDPAPPADALRAMAEDRLKPFGVTGRAVLIIQDASLTRQGDAITGTMKVRLEVYATDNMLAGFAEASTTAQHSGHVGNLRDTLYDMTRSMMDNMNVEFELQIDNNLRDWLTGDTSAPTRVQQAPLDGSPDGMPPPPSAEPVPLAPPPLAPPAGSLVPPPPTAQ